MTAKHIREMIDIIENTHLLESAQQVDEIGRFGKTVGAAALAGLAAMGGGKASAQPADIGSAHQNLRQQMQQLDRASNSFVGAVNQNLGPNARSSSQNHQAAFSQFVDGIKGQLPRIDAVADIESRTTPSARDNHMRTKRTIDGLLQRISSAYSEIDAQGQTALASWMKDNPPPQITNGASVDRLLAFVGQFRTAVNSEVGETQVRADAARTRSR